jgi:hypothetical protein
MPIPALRHALPLTLFWLCTCACAATPVSLDNFAWPTAACTVGDVKHAGQEHWLSARRTGTFNATGEQTFTLFDDNGPARAMRVAMTASALNNLTKVEVGDAQGKWEEVWSGRYRDGVPAGCDKVWFERGFAHGPRLVEAIRFHFALDQMPMIVGGAALLRSE